MAGKFTNEEVKKLANFISSQQFIYQAKHPDHLNTKKIKEKLHAFGQTLVKKRSGEALYKKWIDLRKTFLKKKREMKDALTNSSRQGQQNTVWKHFEAFKFLNDHVGPCSTSISVPPTNH